MRTRPAARLGAAITTLALLAGCASGTVERSEPGGPFHAPPRLTAPASQIVFQVVHGPGYTSFDYASSVRPAVTVYGDGTAYVTADPPASPLDGRPWKLRRGTVPRDELEKLVATTARSGLISEDADYGTPNVTDLGGTSVVFRPGRTAAATTSVYALGYDDASSGLTFTQRSARSALTALIDRIESSVRYPDGRAVTWIPDRIDVREAYDDSGTGLPWPGPPLRTLLRDDAPASKPCGVLDGDAAGAVYRAALTADDYVWVENGRRVSLVIRALLPGEKGCEV